MSDNETVGLNPIGTAQNAADAERKTELQDAENREYLSGLNVQITPLPVEFHSEEFYQRLRHLTGGELNAAAGALGAVMARAKANGRT